MRHSEIKAALGGPQVAAGRGNGLLLFTTRLINVLAKLRQFTSIHRRHVEASRGARRPWRLKRRAGNALFMPIASPYKLAAGTGKASWKLIAALGILSIIGKINQHVSG